MSKIRASQGILLRERDDNGAPCVDAAGSTVVGATAGEDDTQAVVVASAIPTAREFATKMEELMRVAPGLSALLVAVTEGIGGGTHRTAPPAGDPATGEQGMSDYRPPPSVDNACDDVHEFLKVVLTALAQLLSFDHLRASPSVARNLVQAVVNLYLRMGCVSGGDEVSQSSLGSAPSSAGKTPSSSNHESADCSMTDAGGNSEESRQPRLQRRRMGKKTASWVASILAEAFAPKVYGGRTVRSPDLDALLGENGIDSAEHQGAVQAEILHNTQVMQDLAAEGLASRRARRREAGWRAENEEDPKEVLLETILKAFGSVLRTGEDDNEDAPAIQLMLARLREDSYRLLAGHETETKTDRETGIDELEGTWRDPLGVAREFCRNRHRDQLIAPPTSWRQSTSTVDSLAGPPRKHPSLPGSYLTSPSRKRRSFPGPFLLPFSAPHPPPHEWERRIRNCLAVLERRPFLCPDELLRSTGAVPCLPPEAYTEDSWRRNPAMLDRAVEGFRLSHVCLLLTLDMVEEAVLQEGGGEAEAGLLRALRTSRIAGVGAEAGVGMALAGGGRGQMDGAELLALIGLLEEKPSGCPENGVATLAWALQDIEQRYGNSGIGGYSDDAMINPTLRPFEAEMWLLLLGYRHWLMVAMVQLLSPGKCGSCQSVKRPTKRKVTDMAAVTEPEATQFDGSELAQRDSALWLLAWYACGGCTKPASLLERTAEAIEQAAALLEGSGSPSYLDLDMSQNEGCLGTVEALESARKSGQDLVGTIFSPCLAAAWLLTSRAALGDCERVLERGVLLQEDLEGVFGSGASSDAHSRSREDAVLQGVAALEDMVWMAGLQPPLRHIHVGRDLRDLLERVRAWLAGVDDRWLRARERGTEEAVPYLGGGGSGGDTEAAVSAKPSVLLQLQLDDFGLRRDGICRGLEGLLGRCKGSSHRHAKRIS